MPIFVCRVLKDCGYPDLSNCIDPRLTLADQHLHQFAGYIRGGTKLTVQLKFPYGHIKTRSQSGAAAVTAVIPKAREIWVASDLHRSRGVVPPRRWSANREV